MIRNKRAQISLFILIGIVVVIGVAVFIYINSEANKKEIAPGVKVAVEKLPTEFQPVATYVESCIKGVGTNALRRIGETGGFVDVANPNPLDPTESSSVELLQGSGLNVAYWYHLKDSNECSTCMFAFDMPNLYKAQGEPSVESELGEYVDRNLNECLNDFVVFSEQGTNIVPLGGIKTDVSVIDDYVIFIVDYPIQLKREELEETATKFYAAVPSKLKKMYELANYITGLQAANNFLEKDILNLIVGFSGVNEDKLPPMADSRFGFGNIVRWRKSKVKEDIVSMLTSYIPLLQVYGTRTYEEIDVGNDLGNALYNEGMIIPSDGSFGDLEVRFDYLGWNPYFNLNCRGEMCEPESTSFAILQIFGIQNYNFVYDLSFPVLVSIYDPDAFTERGQLFQFMLEGNIRSNEPLNTSTVIIKAIDVEESMFCDIEKMNSGTIKINVKSPYNVPLDNVQVVYNCAGQSCFIGETSRGVLEDKFPICLGGIVSLSKEDYLGQYQYLDTEVGKSSSIDVVLEPLRERKFIIKKKMIEKKKIGMVWQWVPTLREEELGENEEAIISLKRKSSVNDEEYVTTSMIEGQQEGDINLYSGEYDIDISVISRDLLVIPEREESAGFLFWSEDYTIPRVEFNEDNPFISGGLKLTHRFTTDDLYNDVIVFYAVGIDLKGVNEGDRVIEDLEQINMIEEYSQSYVNALKPRFE